MSHLRLQHSFIFVLFLPVEHNERRWLFPVDINHKRFARQPGNIASRYFSTRYINQIGEGIRPPLGVNHRHSVILSSSRKMAREQLPEFVGIAPVS